MTSPNPVGELERRGREDVQIQGIVVREWMDGQQKLGNISG